MGIAESMKNITENIITSNDMRIKAISNLVADIRNILNDFSSKRKKSSDDQKEALNIFVKNLSGKVKNLLKEFQKNRKNMREAQAKSLAGFVKDLDKEVNSMVGDFHKERVEKFGKLKKELAKEISDIKIDVKKLVNEADNLISEYRDDIKNAHNTWQEMSVTLAKSGKGSLTAGFETLEKGSPAEEYVEKKKKRERKQSDTQENKE